jgi:hypothetical protein
MVKYLQTTVDVAATPPSSLVQPLSECLGIRMMMLLMDSSHEIKGLTL